MTINKSTILMLSLLGITLILAEVLHQPPVALVSIDDATGAAYVRLAGDLLTGTDMDCERAEEAMAIFADSLPQGVRTIHIINQAWIPMPHIITLER